MDQSASPETVERFWSLRNRVIEHWRWWKRTPQPHRFWWL